MASRQAHAALARQDEAADGGLRAHHAAGNRLCAAHKEEDVGEVLFFDNCIF